MGGDSWFYGCLDDGWSGWVQFWDNGISVIYRYLLWFSGYVTTGENSPGMGDTLAPKSGPQGGASVRQVLEERLLSTPTGLISECLVCFYNLLCDVNKCRYPVLARVLLGPVLAPTHFIDLARGRELLWGWAWAGDEQLPLRSPMLTVQRN